MNAKEVTERLHKHGYYDHKDAGDGNGLPVYKWYTYDGILVASDTSKAKAAHEAYKHYLAPVQQITQQAPAPVDILREENERIAELEKGINKAIAMLGYVTFHSSHAAQLVLKKALAGEEFSSITIAPLEQAPLAAPVDAPLAIEADEYVPTQIVSGDFAILEIVPDLLKEKNALIAALEAELAYWLKFARLMHGMDYTSEAIDYLMDEKDYALYAFLSVAVDRLNTMPTTEEDAEQAPAAPVEAIAEPADILAEKNALIAEQAAEIALLKATADAVKAHIARVARSVGSLELEVAGLESDGTLPMSYGLSARLSEIWGWLGGQALQAPATTEAPAASELTAKYKVGDKVLVKSGESGTVVSSQAPHTDGRATPSEYTYRVQLDGQSNQWTYLESEVEPYTDPA
jgi:hypothetical protein